LAQSATDVLDEIVQLFDQAVSARESRAADKMRVVLAERGKSGEDRQVLLDAILAIAADASVPDEEVGGLLRGDRIGWKPCAVRLPRRCRGYRVIMGTWPPWTRPMATCASSRPKCSRRCSSVAARRPSSC
jgi:hypothetical protein